MQGQGTAGLRQHLDWFAGPGPEGLVFVEQRGAPFRRSTLGCKFCKARKKVGLSDDFRFYNLRRRQHPGDGHRVQAKDLMVRAGQCGERTQLIYQQSKRRSPRKIATPVHANVRRQR
ncbi:hypothetical protein [Streptomyces lydicus]|uniref:hypothetical protein n=1 Tax=Streptomyces lydicus TaxID=47763 RepID=UPI0037A71EF3